MLERHGSTPRQQLTVPLHVLRFFLSPTQAGLHGGGNHPGRDLWEQLGNALQCEKDKGLINVQARDRRCVGPRHAKRAHACAMILTRRLSAAHVSCPQGSAGRRFSDHVAGLLRQARSLEICAGFPRIYSDALAKLELYETAPKEQREETLGAQPEMTL